MSFHVTVTVLLVDVTFTILGVSSRVIISTASDQSLVPPEFIVLILYLCLVFGANPVWVQFGLITVSLIIPSTSTSYPVAPGTELHETLTTVLVEDIFTFSGLEGAVDFLTTVVQSLKVDEFFALTL